QLLCLRIYPSLGISLVFLVDIPEAFAIDTSFGLLLFFHLSSDQSIFVLCCHILLFISVKACYENQSGQDLRSFWYEFSLLNTVYVPQQCVCSEISCPQFPR